MDTDLKKLKTPADDLQIKALVNKIEFVKSCVQFQCANLALLDIPQMKTHWAKLCEFDQLLPDLNKACAMKQVSLHHLANHEIDEAVVILALTGPQGDEWDLDGVMGFYLLAVFRKPLDAADSSDPNELSAMKYWSEAVLSSPLVSLLEMAMQSGEQHQDASAKARKTVVKLSRSLLVKVNYEMVEKHALVSGTVQVMRAIAAIFCGVPCANGCSASDVGYLCPPSIKKAQIISDIPTSGRVLANLVRGQYQAVCQDYILREGKEKRGAAELAQTTQALQSALAIADTREFRDAVVAEVTRCADIFRPFDTDLREGWSDDFAPVLNSVCDRFVKVTDETLAPDNLEQFTSLNAFVQLVPGVEVAEKVAGLLASWKKSASNTLISGTSEKFISNPTTQTLLDLAKAVEENPSSTLKSREQFHVIARKILLVFKTVSHPTNVAQGLFKNIAFLLKHVLPSVAASEPTLGTSLETWIGVVESLCNVHDGYCCLLTSELDPESERQALRNFKKNLLDVKSRHGDWPKPNSPELDPLFDIPHYSRFIETWVACGHALVEEKLPAILSGLCSTLKAHAGKLRQVARGAASNKCWYTDPDRDWRFQYEKTLKTVSKTQLNNLSMNTQQAPCCVC